VNLLTLKQAAAQLGTSPDNLRARIASGSLKALKVGDLWLVDPKEVARYAAQNRRVSS
jgi:excisionase family DNA binding protein